jgi:hypothetical protein
MIFGGLRAEAICTSICAFRVSYGSDDSSSRVRPIGTRLVLDNFICAALRIESKYVIRKMGSGDAVDRNQIPQICSIAQNVELT